MEFLAVALAVSLAALGSAIGEGWATAAAVSGIARQPEATNEIRSTLITALAFIEALTLFSFAVAILLWIRL